MSTFAKNFYTAVQNVINGDLEVTEEVSSPAMSFNLEMQTEEESCFYLNFEFGYTS